MTTWEDSIIILSSCVRGEDREKEGGLEAY
jgi:hypothetical protein